MAEDNAWAKELYITTLVRNEAQAQDARQKGVKPLLVAGYDDLQNLSSVAESYDSESLPRYRSCKTRLTSL